MWWFERIFRKKTPTKETVAPITCLASADIMYSYQQGGKLVDKIYYKGGRTMVDIEKIKADIEALKVLNAEEYCKDAVAKIYADFEATREQKIAELEKSLEIFEKYQVVEEVVEVEGENAEAVEAN